MARLTHFLVHGDVQGVSFRYHTHKKAISLNPTVKGWVHNVPSGEVEGVIVTSTAEQLTEFKTFLEKGEPPARVDKVEYPFDDEASESQIAKALSNSRTGANFEVRKYSRFAGVQL